MTACTTQASKSYIPSYSQRHMGDTGTLLQLKGCYWSIAQLPLGKWLAKPIWNYAHM